jgi:hypothetical protein
MHEVWTIFDLSSRRDGHDVYDIWTLGTPRIPWRTPRAAKRRIQQGGVRVDEEEIDSQDLDVPFDPVVLLQVGKQLFVDLI